MIETLPMWAAALAAAGGGYLLGSIPFGFIAARLGGAGDIRRVGSGNIGATNVLRTGRRDLALITLLADGGKGAAAFAMGAWLFGPPMGIAAAGAAFLGHLFPVWLSFRGGKGLATFLGILFVAAPLVGISAAVVWLCVFAIGRISSASALVAALAAPPLCLLFHESADGRFWLTSGMALLIFVRHHQNIRRLLAGEEPRVGDKSRSAIS
ncbi:MAG: glycerol-3-phosphate 1-O-acyltransferase PlsY [Caulobacteraceae bacterium]